MIYIDQFLQYVSLLLLLLLIAALDIVETNFKRKSLLFSCLEVLVILFEGVKAYAKLEIVELSIFRH